jgi:hypothetical protein
VQTMPGKGWNCLLRLYASLEHDGFELNRRKHLLHLAPLAGRGRNSLCEFRVRGPIRESDLVERPPHPEPSPRKRGEGEAVRRLNLNSSCSRTLVRQDVEVRRFRVGGIKSTAARVLNGPGWKRLRPYHHGAAWRLSLRRGRGLSRFSSPRPRPKASDRSR